MLQIISNIAGGQGGQDAITRIKKHESKQPSREN